MAAIESTTACADRGKSHDTYLGPHQQSSFVEMKAEKQMKADIFGGKKSIFTILRISQTQPRQTAKFNPAKEILPVLQQLKKFDPSFKVYTKFTTNELYFENFPKDEEIPNHFVYVDETKPGASRAKISLSIGAVMQITLAEIKKHSDELIPFLAKKHISLTVDNYVGDKIATVGIIANVDPRKMNRDHYYDALATKIHQAKFDDSQITDLPTEYLDRWFEEKCNEDSTEQSDDDMAVDEEESNSEWTTTSNKKSKPKPKDHKEVDLKKFKPPKFDIVVQKRFAGSGDKKIQAEFLTIQCALPDVKILKEALMTISLPYDGQFILSGPLHATEDKVNFHKMVIHQANLTEKTVAIQVENLTEYSLKQVINVNNSSVTIASQLYHEKCVDYITFTSRPDTIAILTTRERADAHKKLIDGPLVEAFKNQVPQREWCNGELPCRMDAQRTNSRTQDHVQKTLTSFAETPVNKIPRRSKKNRWAKKPQIVWTSDPENFPALENPSNKPANKAEHHHQSSTPATHSPIAKEETPANKSTTKHSTSGPPPPEFDFELLCKKVTESLAPEIRRKIEEDLEKPDFTSKMNEFLEMKNDITEVKNSLKASEERQEQMMAQIKRDNAQTQQKHESHVQDCLHEIKLLQHTVAGLCVKFGYYDDQHKSEATTDVPSGADSL